MELVIIGLVIVLVLTISIAVSYKQERDRTRAMANLEISTRDSQLEEFTGVIESDAIKIQGLNLTVKNLEDKVLILQEALNQEQNVIIELEDQKQELKEKLKAAKVKKKVLKSKVKSKKKK